MSQTPAGAPEALSPVKRALLEIRDLKAQLAEARGALREPIAIVGMGLRLPGGVTGPESYAALLAEGRDAVGEVPPERWPLEHFLSDDPDAPGKMTTRHLAWVEGVDRFDAEFFGISPREAATMDPQQRLLLEVAWHALEDAGRSPASLAGTALGVYLGISNGDYGRALFEHKDAIDAYFATGNAYSVAAGRISYFLGARGPAVSVDTACSSSLVALHLACQGLRLRECDRALVGGVNLVLTPEMNIDFSKARMMAADGRCKTFDAAADGYVRGEGCAVVVLRRLADALADGDRILAVVRGSALNQDGRSGGLTAPNGPAQEAVIRAALEAAGVAPGEVDYVEAHGTGTSLGDPIEVGALGAVFGPGRDPARPLLVGSVKTNFGHLEAAAGLAGLAKVVLALQAGELPPHLHFKEGNPHIDWSWPISVPTARTPWAAPQGRPRRAGVSSFGFSGTNAHVVLEEAPRDHSPFDSGPRSEAPGAYAQGERGSQGAEARPAQAAHVLPLSARDAGALADLARAWEDRLAGGGEVGDLCFTAGAGRAHFAHRLAVTGADAAGLARALAAHRAGAPAPAVVTGRVEGAGRPQVAFLFTGQGAQHPGMGQALHAAEPEFRRTLEACAAALGPHLGRDLLEVMFSRDAGSPLASSAWAQPANWALEVALAALWRSWGVEPVVVMGHSLGEFAAAVVAGVLSIEDGARLVAARGRLMEELPEPGAMAAVFAPEAAVAPEVARAGGDVTVAAYNGPENLVLSGRRAAVEACAARLAAAGHEVKVLRVPHAAHSALVEPALPGLRRALEAVTFHPPGLALVTNVTGAVAGPETLGRIDHWLAHLREPVRFSRGMETLAALGVTHLVEIGPHPVLLGMGAECLPGPERTWLPSLHRERPEGQDLAEGLARLYAAGAEVDWAAVHRGRTRRRVVAPGYPFRARRHWSELVGQPPAPAAADREARLAAVLDREAGRGPIDVDLGDVAGRYALLARLTSAHAQRILRDAGLFARAGEARTVDEVVRAAGITPTYRRVVARWLEGIAARGLLRAEGEAFVAGAPLPDPGVAALEAEAEARFADDRPLWDYVRHCGSLAGRVVTGEESPLETLFPRGSFALAEGLYERSGTMRYVNGLAAAALDALAGTLPPGRTLRVLEAGAGTGGTSASLLPALDGRPVRYVYTDVSDLFLERGRSRFGARGWVEFRRLDLDADPGPQGLAPGSFDVVVAANAVHAVKDLRATLARLRALLAPGGALVLVESTTHHAWFDLTTGLIEGWQHFQDDLRGDHPLLAAPRWLEVLREAGFAAADAWPRAGSPAEPLGQHVIVARVPGLAAGAAAEAQAEAAPSLPAAQAPAPAGAAAGAAELRRRIAEALPGERLDVLREYVRGHVVNVLRLDPSEPPARNHRLMDLGFDSLMAVQLRNLLGAGLELERPLPASTMFDHPTIDALAARLLELVGPKAPGPAPAAPAAAPAARLDRSAVEGMSEEEVEALLLKRLGKP